jgi:hypothetical protein
MVPAQPTDTLAPTTYISSQVKVGQQNVFIHAHETLLLRGCLAVRCTSQVNQGQPHILIPWRNFVRWLDFERSHLPFFLVTTLLFQHLQFQMINKEFN